MLKITASQIEKWTDENAKKAQALLPELIRRLIAGKLTVKNLYLPSGDSTYLP
ncbi:MAG TPA: hypothetical protein PK765_05370 [bacterium]|nr:hypothetical protein [bacterium]